MKAIYNGTVIAESNETVVVEGNHYFPASSIKKEYFRDSDLNTTCPWKGVASYYHVKVGDEVLSDSAWYYPETKVPAKKIEGYVAFYKIKGIDVTD